jgi:hypothetical protein
MFQAFTLRREHRPRSRQVAGELCQAILIFVEGGDYAHHWLDRGRQRRE